MGKVTITFEDDEADESVVMTTKFDPPVEDEEDASPAQKLGADCIAMWHEQGPEPTEHMTFSMEDN